MVKFKLKEYLEEKKISIRYLARVTGMRYETVRNLVNGDVPRVNLEHLNKVMLAINVSDMNILFERDNSAQY